MTPEPMVVQDLSALPFEAKHVLAHKALLHKTAEMQVNVYVLDPGGKIPAHHHSVSWDVSIVLEGEIEVNYVRDEARERHRCGTGAMTVVPPGYVHEVVNPSATDRATFALIQSPSDGFDFLRHPS